MTAVLERPTKNQIFTVKTQIPKAFKPLFAPSRYKVYYGGRGGAKSHSFAQALLILGRQRPLRVLCTRELQNTIADSVHQILTDKINELQMKDFYDVTKASIIGENGTNFLFKGLRHNVSEIKSTEGIDICWVEEGQRISRESLKFLIPTIRKENSEIWISYNPELDTDPVHQDFVINQHPRAKVVKVTYRDNPFFPDVLKQEMEDCRALDLDLYMHVWEGECITISDANIIKRVRVDTFEAPKGARLYFGADFGFANDPNTLNRFYIHDDRLWIEYEAHQVRCELDDMPKLYDTVPGSREWPIKADAARPETISYLRRQGFNISAAKKWKGSILDGITHINGFKEVVIHPRCVHTLREARLYRYKIDPVTNTILPIIPDDKKSTPDKHNHHWDDIRYGLDGVIQRRGADSNLLRAVTT